MLGRYRAPDALPDEGYGFENEHDDEDDEDEYANPSKKRSGPIKSSSGEFSFEFFEGDYGLGPDFALLYGNMVSVADNVTVGRLCGDLVTRGGGSNYFSMCDSRSQDLIDLARVLTNSDGTLRRPLCAKIKDAARIKAAGKGGLLFLDEVHILQSYRGRDLSLEFMFALFRYLGRRWTLAVSTVVPWDHADQQRDRAAPRSEEEHTRLCRHFARVGLKQVDDTHWFLERSQQPKQPLPRGAVAALAVYHPAKQVERPELSELDQKLASAVEKSSRNLGAGSDSGDVDALAKVKEALKAGASIQAACALHYAVGPAGVYGAAWRPDALHFLIASRANIEQTDFQGMTPLHVAANARSERAVRALLEYGADPLARIPHGSHSGMAPLEMHINSTAAHIQSMQDFGATFGYGRMARGPGEETEDARRTRELMPCSHLLQRATAARTAQQEVRACLVRCLMYWQSASRQALSSDVLRKIHAAVAPVRPDEYPPLTGLLQPDTPVVVGALGRADLNGQHGTLLGTDETTGRYMVSFASGTSIKVKPDNVLPLERREGGDEDMEDVGDESDDDW